MAQIFFVSDAPLIPINWRAALFEPSSFFAMHRAVSWLWKGGNEEEGEEMSLLLAAIFMRGDFVCLKLRNDDAVENASVGVRTQVCRRSAINARPQLIFKLIKPVKQKRSCGRGYRRGLCSCSRRSCQHWKSPINRFSKNINPIKPFNLCPAALIKQRRLDSSEYTSGLIAAGWFS